MIQNKKSNISRFISQRSPTEILIFGFAFFILFGAFLLMLPISSRSGEATGFINALFNATSSVCVTGLVVVDTGTYWSVFGQTVMCALVEIGGLGFMSFATMFFVLAGKRITIKDRILIQSSVNMDSLSGIVKFAKYIFFSSFIIQAIGALLLAIVFIPEFGWVTGIGYSVFHSVTSFC
ncbi:MAG: Trk family potassium uptake protein, partial [Acetobacterium sp.]|nr:Trk family potassium uptake protein [Acetobacterium sp.]